PTTCGESTCFRWRSYTHGNQKIPNKNMRNVVVILMICSMSALFSCSAKKDYLVTIETKHGNIYVILYDETPVHKENFLNLAREGRFDSTAFHRIIKGFMVQGGDVF